MMKKFALLFLLVVICASSSYAYSGNGTSSNPYVIGSYSDFVSLMQSGEATAEEGKYFALSCDIQLSIWESVGNNDMPFTGHFDGQGHTIYVNIGSSLFGVVDSEGEAIINLNVEGNVQGHNAGGLVSVLKSGIIRNCSFSGDVTAESSPSGTNAGGIVAVMLGGKIENCIFRGTVTAKSGQSQAIAGGIVGFLETYNRALENNTSYGTIEGNISGGIVGALGSNTYAGIAIGTGNFYSGADLGIGRDEWGKSTDGVAADGTSITRVLTMSNTSKVYASDLVISADGLPKASINRAYSAEIKAYSTENNQIISANWVLIGGALPDGLELTTSEGKGKISGTPSEAGNFTFTVVATAGTLSSTMSFTLVVKEADFSITTGLTLRPGIKGVGYDNTLTTDAPSSLGSRIWYIDEGSLPPGLRLLRESGKIIGTPTEEGTFTFRVRLFIKDQIASKNFTMTIIPGFSIITDTILAPGIQGTEYTQTLSTDAPKELGDQVWYINEGSLPPGLTISRDSGVITGTPTEEGTFTLSVTLLIGELLTSKSFSITIIPGFSITTEPSLPPGVQGVEYLQALSTDAPASLGQTVWYVDEGTLPQGLKLDRDNGTISGTPTEEGKYTFRIKLLIGNHTTAKTFTLLIAPGFIITTDTLPDGKEGIEYEEQLTASEKISLWRLYSGTFPPGLSINADGKITGTPERSGEYEFIVQAQSGNLATTKNLTIKINPAFMITTSADLPNAKVGELYSLTLETDAPQPVSVRWQIISGDLPEGLKLNPENGNISGTPVSNDTFIFTVQAVYRNFVAVKRFSLPVGSALEILNDSVLEAGKIGKQYTCIFSADTKFPVQWTLTDGNIPDGLVLNNETLSGIPSAEGIYKFTLTAKAGGLTASKAFTLTIGPALSITTPSILPSAKAETYYSYTLSSDAEEGSIVLWFANGLPSGLHIEEDTGTIYGIATSEGTYSFTVLAVIGDVSASKEFTLTVKPRFSITTDENLPHAEVNDFYSVTLSTDAEENEVVTWSLTAGALPEGLNIDAQTGIISGYPLAEGNYKFTVQAVMNGLRATKEFFLTAGEAMSIITQSTIPVINTGSYFSLQLETDPKSKENSQWSLAKGVLPPGLKLDAVSGLIAGTPLRAGKYTFTVQIVSGYSFAQKEFSVIVDFAISGDTYLPDGEVGVSYSYRFYAEGMSSGILWSTASSSLPQGIILRTDGLLTGTTNEAGTYNFMIYAFVSNDFYAKKTIRLRIVSHSAMPILTTSLPDGKVNEDYYAELNAAIEDVTWKCESGDFPPGLKMLANGVITGIPSREGTYQFIAHASTSTRDGTRQFTIRIAPEDKEPVSNTGGGGGGCNSGLGFTVLVILIPALRKRLH